MVKRLFEIPDVEKVGVYMIENVQTRRRYVGSTCNIKKRLKLHERCLRLHGYINAKTYEDVEAGNDLFFCTVLKTFEDGEISQSELTAQEAKYMSLLCSEDDYNIKPAVQGRLYGRQKLYHYGNIGTDGKKGNLKRR